MTTSPLHLSARSGHKPFIRVRDYLLIVAALLSLAALITHHPGLLIFAAATAVLLQLLFERVTSEPEGSQNPHHAKGYRFTDGGSFRDGDHKKSATRSAQSPIVLDGGSH